jgi:hypothetical protein
MKNASEILIDYITNEGAIEGSIVTVESFLNHKVIADLLISFSKSSIDNLNRPFLCKLNIMKFKLA